MADQIYWTMKDGRKIKVDDMDIDHLRNTLKMLLRTADKIAIQKASNRTFKVNGELAQEDADRYELYKATGGLSEDLDDDLFHV